MPTASPMNTPEIIQAITPLIEVFERFDIPYYIGGSVASSLHGKRRATQDVDIVADIQRKHVQTLVKLLENEYYIDAGTIHGAIQHQSSLKRSMRVFRLVRVSLYRGLAVSMFVQRARLGFLNLILGNGCVPFLAGRRRIRASSAC